MSDVLHQILETAQRGPRQVAVKDANSTLTYDQLVGQVGAVATVMVDRGVLPGDRVVLLLQNSIDYVVSALACLWIGAVFVPLDGTDPMQRLASLIRDCQPALVIANDSAIVPELLDVLEATPVVEMKQLQNGKAGGTDVFGASERPSYIIYTSGTTGTPKGVVIGSGAFEAAVSACAKARDLGPDTKTLCVSPFHFDGSFATLFTTLVSGGTVVIRPREALLFARVFFNVVVAESITYTGFTPSYLRLLSSSPEFGVLAKSKLEVIALGGESLTPSDVERIWSVVPRVRIFNGYGPTETTITASQKEVTREVASGGVIPIGKPNPGVQFYLVDDGGNLLEGRQVLGELYIGGNQMMDGYWASPALTERVIRTDIIDGQRLYRTGDIAYRNLDNDFVYVNRADRVIKRSGVRISLLEISEAFSINDDVSAATSIAFDNDGVIGVATFVVVASPNSPYDLHRRAREILPPTMLPNEIFIVESIPLTSSGKADERRLLTDAGLSPWTLADPSPAP